MVSEWWVAARTLSLIFASMPGMSNNSLTMSAFPFLAASISAVLPSWSTMKSAINGVWGSYLEERQHSSWHAALECTRCDDNSEWWLGGSTYVILYIRINAWDLQQQIDAVSMPIMSCPNQRSVAILIKNEKHDKWGVRLFSGETTQFLTCCFRVHSMWL